MNKIFSVLILATSILSLFSCTSKKTEQTKASTVSVVEIDSLEVSFTPPANWIANPNFKTKKGGFFGGVQVAPLSSFIDTTKMSVLNISKLIPETRDNSKWLISYQDSIKQFLEKDGDLLFKNYAIDVFEVSHWSMANEQVMVHKLYYTSQYTSPFVVDVIAPRGAFDSTTALKIIESTKTFRFKGLY